MNIDFDTDEDFRATATNVSDNAGKGADNAFVGLIVGVTLASILFSVIFIICCFKLSRRNMPTISGEETTPQDIELSRKVPRRNDSLQNDMDDASDLASELTLHSVSFHPN